MTLPGSATPTGAEQIVATLQDLGVRLVFGLPGVHNLPVWKALAASDIRLVGVRHEQAAVYAADGYARASGEVGVAIVTTGPGAANTAAATGEAMASGSPVLLLATDIPTSLRRPGIYRGVLHETRDQAAMFAPITKQARTVSSAESIARAVHGSAVLARTSASGPVYLGIPTDLLTASVPPARVLPQETAAIAVDRAALEAAAGLLGDAERPLIWAGGGALRAEAGAAVAELAIRLDAPVITTYMARGLLPADHLYLAPGPVHASEVGALWDAADLVLAIGTDFDGMMTQNWRMPAPSKLVSINIDAAEANKNYASNLTLVGDARQVGEALCEMLPPRPAEPLTPERLRAIGIRVRTAVADDEPEALRFLDALGRAVPADAVIVADMCIPGYWLAGFGRIMKPRKLAYPVGWGTLGFGFPASLGAALSGVTRAVCVTGDGGFLFACGELATVAQEELPLTVVLVDDGGYGMLRFDQHHAGDEAFGVDLHTPDFGQLAEAFGIPARTTRGFGRDFEAALSDTMVQPGPALIVVKARLTPPVTTSPRWYRQPSASDSEAMRAAAVEEVY